MSTVPEEFKALTEREWEVLVFWMYGWTLEATGKRLNISPKTISTHRSHIIMRTGAKNGMLLAQRFWARYYGFYDLEMVPA